MEDSVDNPPAGLLRVGFYVDGFNLYHPLNEMKRPYLKWLDLMTLAETVIRQKTQFVAKVGYYSALRPDRNGSRNRHNAYMNALVARGVGVVRGHYIDSPRECEDCRHQWNVPSEKQTDINMALAAVCDASDGQVDAIYLLTADSDHAATFRVLRERFPDMELVSVVPPGRSASEQVMRNASRKVILTEELIDRCVMAGMVMGQRGPIRRPDDYKPPVGWIPFNERPKK